MANATGIARHRAVVSGVVTCPGCGSPDWLFETPSETRPGSSLIMCVAPGCDAIGAVLDQVDVEGWAGAA